MCTLQVQISPCLERENSSANVDIGACNTFGLWCSTSPNLVGEHHLRFTQNVAGCDFKCCQWHLALFLFENQGLCRIKRAPGPRTGSVAAHPTSTVFPSWMSTVKCVEHTKNAAKVTGFPEEVIWFWTLCWLHIYSGLIPCGCAFLLGFIFTFKQVGTIQSNSVLQRYIQSDNMLQFLTVVYQKVPNPT